MASNTVADVLSDLQKFYNKELSDTQIEFYANQLAVMDEDDLCHGVIALKRKERFFPMIATVEQYVTDAREFRLQREKERAPTLDDLETNSQCTENGKQAIALMRDLYEHRINRQQYLARMCEMEEKFLGIGWKQSAEELKQFWKTEPERYAKGKHILETLFPWQK